MARKPKQSATLDLFKDMFPGAEVVPPPPTPGKAPPASPTPPEDLAIPPTALDVREPPPKGPELGEHAFKVLSVSKGVDEPKVDARGALLHVVDAEALRLKERLGVGFGLSICMGPSANLVMIGWHRLYKGHSIPRRGAFLGSISEAIAHAHAYEDVADAKGEDAAKVWQEGFRVRSEAEAVRDLEEKGRAVPPADTRPLKPYKGM